MSAIRGRFQLFVCAGKDAAFDAHNMMRCVIVDEGEEGGEAGDAEKKQQRHDEAEAGKEDAVTSTASIA